MVALSLINCVSVSSHVGKALVGQEWTTPNHCAYNILPVVHIVLLHAKCKKLKVPLCSTVLSHPGTGRWIGNMSWLPLIS